MLDDYVKNLMLFVLGAYGVGFFNSVLHSNTMTFVVVITLYLLIEITFGR